MGLLLFLAVSGCDQKQSEPREQTRLDQSPNGRSETKNIQAASAVGYNGKQLQKRVDKILDRNDQRKKELEDAVNKAEDQ